MKIGISSMPSETFRVLDRHQDIHKNYLIEASAGTGKTFSIENIVVRLLIGEKAIPIEQLLIVTFTRMATRDLRMRIRSNIDRSIIWLNDESTNSPDFLKAIIEQGNEAKEKAIKLLQQALYHFDQAQIFTIHSFCARMLRSFMFEGDISAKTENLESGTNLDQINLRIIRDFIRTELREELFSPEQLILIANESEHSSEKLEKSLLTILNKHLPISPVPDLNGQLLRFKNEIKRLKISLGYDKEKILADFQRLAPNYEKLCDRNRLIKLDVFAKVETFASLFDKCSWEIQEFDQLIKEGLFLVEALDSEHLKVKAKPIEANQLHYPHLLEDLKQLDDIIKEARNPNVLLARMAFQCQKLMQLSLSEEERLGFDDLLTMMQKALKNPLFTNAIRQNYKAAIIDEFQDTDPVQWEIFQTLFLNDTTWGSLYLVGDPKQSIYAFRQADIYTYLAAADAMGSHATLNTNFRSQPSLVNALNTLFSSSLTPDFISLPRLNSSLAYHPVEPSTIPEKIFNDQRGSIHFCITPIAEESKKIPQDLLEQEYLLPFFCVRSGTITSTRSDDI